MQLTDFDFKLPEHLIAQSPLHKRSDSRLLCLDKKTGVIAHHFFYELPKILFAQDLLVLNNTQVIPARLYAQKATGGKVEILLERSLGNKQLLAQTKSCKALKIGERLFLNTNTWFTVIGRKSSLFILQLHAANTLEEVLNQFGQVPLPPYIKHAPSRDDRKRYQTIYAKHPGAIAAPTAGLHFDTKIMQDLSKRKIATAFVTLHVGLGTFQPIRVTNITEHKMHAEYIIVSEKTCEQIDVTRCQGGRIIAVGTTSLRALETASSKGKLKPYCGDTELFIYPGYKFRAVDVLLTNFHLPKTSLLMLVAAFAGYENTMRAYHEAIEQQYRFYSYGDAMLIV